ncbi:uncharacterized protein LOC108042305 [Drosophila rhopaloa]|uniref:Uncharacterized protein LOC108042305 n=1 Tax=Drosophila rhopaloa TaxID=1041015 RepID=A0A6P4ELW2_DRORH|nr:uncharacterized protein LOC108042305 [Drosophila rhopaloa]
MKIIAVILLANLGCILCQVEILINNANRRMRDYVEKYKNKATGNAELTKWIEDLFHIYTDKDYDTFQRLLKLHTFVAYDEDRKQLEDRITERINELKTLIRLKTGGKRCVMHYEKKLSLVQGAYKLHNDRKQRILIESGGPCSIIARKKRKQDPYEDYNENESKKDDNENFNDYY